MDGGEDSLDFLCAAVTERSDNDGVAVVVIEYKYVVGPTIRLNWESASEITEGVVENRCINGVSACGDGSWWCLFVEWFAATLLLLVEMAFGSGNGWVQVAANDLGCKIGPGGEKILFGGFEESADTWTEGVTEFRQPLQVQSHLEMPGILVQLGHIQRT